MSVKLEPLGSSILVPFSDYSKWERRPVNKRSDCLAHLKTPKEQFDHQTLPPNIKTSSELDTSKQVSNNKYLPWSSYTSASRAWLNRGELTSSNLPSRMKRARKLEPVNVRMLKNKITAKKTSVDAYHTHKKYLLDDNMAMINTITNVEENTYATTDRMLDRYRHFKGTLSTMKMKSREILEEAKQELEDKRTQFHQRIENIISRVTEINDKLESGYKELQVLRHYKEKEYPVRAIKIDQLKEEKEELQAQQAMKEEELKIKLAEEKESYEQKLKTIRSKLQIKATEDYLLKIKTSIKAKAVQNMTMGKETILHQRIKTELLRDISELKSAIASMKQDMHLNNRKRIATKLTVKCLPDTEIILNIPTQEQLPV